MVKRRNTQNAVSALGHFFSWATEFSVIGLAIAVMFFVDKAEMDVDVMELVTFFYPCVNLVVFPLVQLVSSAVLRKEARSFFKVTQAEAKTAVVRCISENYA